MKFYDQLDQLCLMYVCLIYVHTCTWHVGFPGGSVLKNTPAVRERWFHPRFRKIPWRRNGSPLQYSCLENPMDRGAWWATVHGVAKELDMT